MKKTLTTTLLAILMCVCMVFGFTACGIFNDKCEHTYDNACDTTCNKCEETRTITHAWVAADCDTPKTCKICGKTEGEELGHDWEEADCDTPKICKICGNTEGEELGHDWVDADCDTPKTCSVCGATEGDELGHMAEYDDGDCTTELICTCGYTIVPARSHEPVDDDGDCYTALMCKNCLQFVRAGQSEHSKTDIDENWKCDNPGCEQEILVTLNGVVFKLNDDKESCYVSGFSGIDGTEINIPATCNGLPVIAIGDSAFFNRGQFTSVTFDEDSKVEKIGVNAFANCNALESITIPDSVTAIDEAALSDCPVLKSVTFGEDSKLKTIGNQAFAGCSALQNITIPDSVTTIGEGAFKFCPVLESITIPSFVTAISDMAFSECYRLKSVTLPDTVTTIGEHAFSSTLVESIFIPASVEKVGYYSFYDCPALKTVIFGENSKLATVGYSAFIACGSLTSVYYGGSRADWEKIEIDELAIPYFATIYTYSADIPTTEGNYWRYVDGAPTAWKEVALGGVVYQLNEDGESYTVTGLASDFEGTVLNIPATVNGKPVTTIGYRAFYMSTSFSSVTIPDSVTTISGYAFNNCAVLKSVTFGENSKLTTIGGYAFSECYRLKSVTIPDSVETIGGSAFYRTALTSIYYNGTKSDWDNKVSKGGDAIPSNATVYFWSEGLSFTQNKDEDGNLLDSYSVTGLGSCTDTDVIIPSKYNGKSVTAIGESAFNGCTSLTSVIIPDSVTTISQSAFNGCTGLTSVIIPDSVTTISQSAFNGCTDLTSVIIPASVETIGEGAFSECENLTRVYYDGTASAWAEVSVGEEAIPATATVYYYSASQPTDEGDYWYYFDGVPVVWEVIAIEQIIFDLNEDGESYSVTGLKDGFDGTFLVIPATYEGKPVTAIGDYAFCPYENGQLINPAYLSLTSVTIPDSVTTIGDYAFFRCTALKSVTFGENSKLEMIGESAFGSTGLTSVTFGENSQLTTIGRSAFVGTGLTSVTIPDSVSVIGERAFYGTALESVTIPDSVTTIGERAFMYCSSLTSVTFGENSQLTTIGTAAFSDCTGLTSVTIPDSVTTIGEFAFYGTALESVYYGGTEADWGDKDKITVGDDAIPTNATVYYYSENKPEGEGNYWHYDANGVPTTEWDD